ncbi:MAG: hypothetical protein HRF50_15690 [Phycisphaerae bacterium]|jgi:hypothetical protein
MSANDPRERRAAPASELYVGYLPVPAGQRLFLRACIPMLAAAFLAAGGLWSGAARSPGRGVWETNAVRTLDGVAYTHPYAMIRVPDAHSPDGARTVLLVQEGKRGAADAIAPFDGRLVRVRGYTLERDGRQMLELAEGGVEPISAPSETMAACLRRPVPAVLGPVCLSGEIIDPKCYLGAMKPGEGRTHKECATLCVAGGIPPMFVTRAASGAVEYFLLVDASGGPATKHVLEFVADPVELSGVLERWGDLLVLKLTPGAIRRL